MDIISQINNILNDISRKITADNEMDLFANEILDSLGVARLIARLESEYNIEIDIDDVVPMNFINVIAIAALVKKYIKE